jgi:hypothetical protein
VIVAFLVLVVVAATVVVTNGGRVASSNQFLCILAWSGLDRRGGKTMRPYYPNSPPPANHPVCPFRLTSRRGIVVAL